MKDKDYEEYKKYNKETPNSVIYHGTLILIIGLIVYYITR